MPLRFPRLPGDDAREEEVKPSVDPVIERVADTGSTNDDLLARVHAATAAGVATFAPCLLVADRQRAGRGRHGRRWHAEPAASLTFSIAWPCARGDLSGLSLAIGSALADTLDPPSAAARIGVKWPNDLWLVDPAQGGAAERGRKLAGVLVETLAFGAGRVAVIGIGINITRHPVPDAASGFASLDEIDPDATPVSVLDRVAPAMFDALRRFDRAGWAEFATAYARRDLLRGRRIAGAGAAGAIEGIAAGVDADGSLLVATPAGTVPVRSGEWHLARAEPAGSPC